MDFERQYSPSLASLLSEFLLQIYIEITDVDSVLSGVENRGGSWDCHTRDYGTPYYFTITSFRLYVS